MLFLKKYFPPLAARAAAFFYHFPNNLLIKAPFGLDAAVCIEVIRILINSFFRISVGFMVML